jgi:hypothetical protein
MDATVMNGLSSADSPISAHPQESRGLQVLRRLRVFVVVATAAVILVAATPSKTEAKAYFGNAGVANTQLTCTPSTRTVTISIAMYGTVVGQAMGRHLFVWNPATARWDNAWPWAQGTAEASLFAFQSGITFSTSSRVRYFYTKYFWYWDGWKPGSPTGEQTSIYC